MKPHVGYAQLIGIVGPTGSGKSALALSMARHHKIEILNGDSLQVYQRLNIGTAKPSPQEMSICPHHLFDLIPPPQTWTAGDFRKAALEIIARGDPKTSLLIVGGSGFYLQALASGMFEAPALEEPARTELRKRFEGLSSEKLHFHLSTLDLVSSTKIHPQDRYRILRALEVLEVTGKPLSQIHSDFQREDLSLPIRWIGLNRPRALQETALQKRIQQMFSLGWLDEVQELLDQGLGPWAPLQSVGYREIVDFLQAPAPQIDLLGLQKLITIRHMQLSKKQMTWFRRLPEATTQWFDSDVQKTEAQDYLSQMISHLAPPLDRN